MPWLPEGGSASVAQRDEAMPRVPVVVVTGYLGSGKTTLIAALIARPDMTGTAVIVNELAEVGIDQAILGDAGADDVVLLSNGCLCCGSGTDLRNAIARLLRRRQGLALNRILVETSGAADPGPILQQIHFDPVLRSQLRYGGVLVLFDVLDGQEMLARDPVGLRQLGLADRILMTKTDLAEQEQTEAARRFLLSLNPEAQVTDVRDDAVRFAGTAGRGIANDLVANWFRADAVTAATTLHETAIGTWSVCGDRPVSWRQIETPLGAIFDRHRDNVLRTKGLLWTEEDERPLVLHGIGRRFHRPVRLARWDGAPMSRFVIIGFPGAADAASSIADLLGGRIGLITPNRTT